MQLLLSDWLGIVQDDDNDVIGCKTSDISTITKSDWLMRKDTVPDWLLVLKKIMNQADWEQLISGGICQI